MKTDYRVLREVNTDENEIIIVLESQIQNRNLYECYDNYGQQVGHYNAGDYAIDNSACSAADDCKAAIAEKFNIDVDDIEFEENSNDCYEIDADYIELDDAILAEIKSFIKSWQTENEIYTEVNCINYWDGHNHRTKVVDGDETVGGTDYESVEDELEEEILEAYEEAEFGEWSYGHRQGRAGNWLFDQSQFQDAFMQATVTALDGEEESEEEI